ncbi:cytochrome b5 domain-containing protein [Alloiococcus sp. CFN-8]|uniref:cytochrome b5 domain-containing protein n=1 Tax=Alloiococcus sp. CFN-8 TaxID=3416081 RepID=UPI003CF6008F
MPVFYCYYPYQYMYTQQYYTMNQCSYCHPWVRMYCENMTMNRKLYNNNSYYMKNSHREATERVFTLEELGKYDGSGGNPAYVAVNGVVYDMSREATWGGGTHFGLYAGKDLTSEFQGCHGMAAILMKLPKVGIIKG